MRNTGKSTTATNKLYNNNEFHNKMASEQVEGKTRMETLFIESLGFVKSQYSENQMKRQQGITVVEWVLRVKDFHVKKQLINAIKAIFCYIMSGQDKDLSNDKELKDLLDEFKEELIDLLKKKSIDVINIEDFDKDKDEFGTTTIIIDDDVKKYVLPFLKNEPLP